MTDHAPALTEPFELAPSVLRAVVAFIDTADIDRMRHLYGQVFGSHAVRSDTLVGNGVMREILRDHVMQTLKILSFLHIVPTDGHRPVPTPEDIDALISEIGRDAA